MFCPKCGTSNTDDAAVCTSCGNSLKVSGPSSAGSPYTPPPEFSLGTIPMGPATFTMAAAFTNAINLLKNPAAFMRQNKDNAVTVNSLMINYVAVLAAVPFVATLVGDLWYFAYRGIYGYAFAIAIATYVLDLAAVYVIGMIIWKLGPNFGTTTDQAKATLLAAFVYTPVFLISILTILPFISWITFLGLIYGLYVLYLGLPIVLGTPPGKEMTYIIAIVVVAIIVYAVIGAIIGAITAVFFLRSFFLP
jgi:Yip1 domain/zinc-ribbon domain